MSLTEPGIRERWGIDPYRILFPLGWALGLLGASLWIVFYLTSAIPYPATVHANVMMGGFQLCFAAGFLMTAIPRFTGTESASFLELLVALVLGSCFLAFSLVATVDPSLSVGQSWLTFAFSIFLAGYFFRRFVKRAHSPPPSFSFVGTALAYAALGNLALALATDLPPQAVLLGRLLFYHGMMLALVLGVGSRLVTANLGWMQGPIVQIMRQTRTPKRFEFLRSSYGTSWGLALVFTASFVIEALWAPEAGRILRALVVGAVILPAWKLHRLPRSRTKMAFWLWSSAWCVLLGSFAYALSPPSLLIAGAHLMFIGGFSLMIFVIASRVTLSHGGFDLSFEARSNTYALVGGLTLLAALSRFAANLASSRAYPVFLVLAACLLAGALIVWGATFLTKAIRPHKLRHPRQAA